MKKNDVIKTLKQIRSKTQKEKDRIKKVLNDMVWDGNTGYVITDKDAISLQKAADGLQTITDFLYDETR